MPEVMESGHPSTATKNNNMENVYCKQGNYDKALKYYEKALTIRERVLAKEHPDTVMTYNNLESVYFV